ncbi:MAG: hypothetical protein ACOC3X_01660 [Nanoarchaeota archaeon]
MITIEELNNTGLIKQIRINFPTDDYLVIRSEKMIKKITLPIEN